MPTAQDNMAARAGESVQDHKTRVMEASRAHAEAQKVAARATTNRPPEGFPKSPSTPSNIPDFMKDAGVQTPIVPEPQRANSNGSSPAGAPASSANPNEAEWQRVYREKGWKDPGDALRSYEALEREFHTRNQQPRPQAAPVPPVQYVPVQQPPMMNPVDQLARRHGIAPEDAQRLAPFTADVARAIAEDTANMIRNQYEPVVNDLRRKVQRQEDLNAVMSDPAMRNPRVQVEVSKVFLENPSVFSYEANPYQWALGQALRNIAQESLGAYRMPEGAGAGQQPNMPPVTAGGGSGNRGGGTGVPEPNIDLAGNYFKLKTAAEKREMLAAMGVVPDA